MRYPGAGVAAWRALGNAAALATIMIATLLALNAYLERTDDLRATPATRAASDCSARYAALLDLAELARRDGKSSEMVVRGLSERNGAMSECLPAGRGRSAPQSH
ncbi:hypothetical protein BJG93_17915 [Paraburkholderia sprentiae WSM5005]|uniref:Uncharacterized protein n=2 Tax=Paraburkholderia sprentiae TaxID=948107 RepID=A0A1I9YSF8_9BURK|nr:hypothetical protein BJG93_17915 [Paraburkholderia sprentiae WSM5005]